MDEIEVLVCDDSALMRNLISRIIDGTEGMKVCGTAMNGKFALQKLDTLKPDMILLDIEMPEMNGVQFLEERKKQVAGTLSGGEQQMLAMGRALMSKPKIVLMDEPSMGLSPLFVAEVFKIIEEIRAGGTTVLLVEQNAKKALEIADRAYVLETGKIVLSGDAKELMNNDSVKKAYLGE